LKTGKRWAISLLVLLFVRPSLSLQQNAESPAPHSQPNQVLTGEVRGTQNKTYFEVPFTVPDGTHRISVDFHYTGSEQRSVLDLGIADPQRFRGSSGGNKSHFTISETDATPSYLPGAIPSGQWHLLIAVPNIRPASVAHYRAEIRFNAHEEEVAFAPQPLIAGKRWYRGDLHMHTAHSDGSCPSQSGREVPCPLFLTVQTAASRGLDFIAITDHNTTSQNNDMRELQPYFDRTLLIPGREMTTFYGHFNIFGVTQFMDWRVTKGGLDLNAVVRDALSKGGIASVNHGEAPGGEDCMGCRWEPAPSADMGLFSAIEVINGGEIMFSSAKLWDAQLAEGHRLAAIGGSDSHNATAQHEPPGSIGWPTTVVEAGELSVPAILNAIRSGRTFIDLTASHDKVLDFEAEAGAQPVSMGGTLHTVGNATIHVHVHTTSAKGSLVHLLIDGKESDNIAAMPVDANDSTVAASLPANDARHWLRVEVRDSAGTLQLTSSPLYINLPE
jgi:hypothetical protein